MGKSVNRKTNVEIINDLLHAMKNQEQDFRINTISNITGINWDTVDSFFEMFLALGIIDKSLMKNRFHYNKTPTYWRKLYMSEVRLNGALKVIIEENKFLQRR